MRGLIVAAMVAASQGVAQTAPKPADDRATSSWLTPMGLGLGGMGIAMLVLGVHFQLAADDASAMLKIYYPTTDSAPDHREAATVLSINRRLNSSATLAAVGLIGGAALVVGGVSSIVFDRLLSGNRAVVVLAPMLGGASASVTVHW